MEALLLPLSSGLLFCLSASDISGVCVCACVCVWGCECTPCPLSVQHNMICLLMLPFSFNLSSQKQLRKLRGGKKDENEVC